MTESLMKNGSAHAVVIVPTNNNNKPAEKHVQKKSQEYVEPPDGGARAFLVMISAFMCNGILFGIINTYSVIYLSLQKSLESSGDAAASGKASLVGSLTIGATFLFSPVSGILVDKLGLRTTTLLGGILTTLGMYLSSCYVSQPFDPDNIFKLYITYGIMFGTGVALAYTPTLAILGHYFKRYLGVVNGFVTAGSSVFTIIMPEFLTYVEKNYGLKSCLHVMTAMSATVIIYAFIYKPLQPPPPVKARKVGRSPLYNLARSIINFDNWKKKKYIIWAISIPVALFGYFIPYVHIAKFVEGKFPTNNKNLPIMCIGITSGLGRIIFGMISDMPKVDRLLLQQISFYLIGLMTMCLPLTENFTVLIGVSLVLGLFDGCFISLLGPIAYDICGPAGAAQAIGFLLGLCSPGLTAGPPLAGKLFDKTGSYTIPFVLAGIPPMIGATIMFLTKFVKPERNANDEREIQPFKDIQPHVAWDHENGKPGNGYADDSRKATLANAADE